MAMTKWEWGGRIGSGGFGVVKHATRVDDGLPFAVKFLLEQHEQDPEALRRFKREVEIQRSLSHPNVLPVVDADLEDSPPWFTMPIAASTLHDEIDHGLPEEEADRFLEGILAGVAYAHEQGVVHRDLKPENVIITHDGTPQVSDFGLGRNLLSDSSTLTRTMAGAGSFPFIAPEQMLDLHGADRRADIYALGKILQHMVTGELPTASASVVSGKYRYLVAKCTEHEREDRYQSMADLVSAFQQVIRGVEHPEAPIETAKRLAEDWEQLPPGEDIAMLHELQQLLERHADNPDLYQEVVPELPEGLVRDYVRRLPNQFRRMVEQYDEHVSGRLVFAYCDVVASFYLRLWNLTDDLAIRKLILARLIRMGSSHNRFFVGQVVGTLLPTITDTSEVMMASDVLTEQSEHTDFFRPYVQNTALAVPIAEAMHSNGRHAVQTDDGELPS